MKLREGAGRGCPAHFEPGRPSSNKSIMHRHTEANREMLRRENCQNGDLQKETETAVQVQPTARAPL